MNDEIIIIHLLMYLQNMIDSGQHKLFYNDLMHDEKVIDIINAITNLQEENEKYKKIFEGKERFSKIMPEDIDFIILSKSDYDRQEKDIQLELIDYKSRVNKAIEYIYQLKQNAPDEEMLDKIINILNGGDE